jgi:hypothetical protein
MTEIKNNTKAPRPFRVQDSVLRILRAKMIQHNKTSKYKVNMRQLEAVYRRGVGAYNTNPSSVRGTVTSSRQWGIARVNAWLKGVNGKFPRSPFDLDLLPTGHPKKPKKDAEFARNADSETKADNVEVGDYVSWSIPKDPDPPSVVHGIVEQVRTSGTISIGNEKYVASDDKPVAIMRVYAQVDGDHKRTDRRVARYISSLRIIDNWTSKKKLNNYETKQLYLKEYENLQKAWISYFTDEYRKVLSDERRRILVAMKSSSTMSSALPKISSEIAMTKKISVARFKEVGYSLVIDFGSRILDIFTPEKGYGKWQPTKVAKYEKKQTRREIINRGFYPNRTEAPVISANTPTRLLYNRQAIQMVDEKLNTLFNQLGETQTRKLNLLFRKAAEGGTDYIDLVKAVEKQLGEKELSRAGLIARTEVRSLSSFAQQQGAILSQKVKIKTWQTIQDPYTRDWHSNADGQKRKLDERYVVNGESIMYPGDGSGANRANCRCTEIYSEL